MLAWRLTAFQRQESTFVILDLVILAVLLVLHALFWSYWGNPAAEKAYQPLTAAPAECFRVQSAEEACPD
ncbi:MAG: hypothetical protein DMG70_24735 [Acidobacteria bacterium]|nr:MAG: hypothetical protein DMG70_24735 [Acidobacteriota bacterium]PYY09764.1 MAG: hypothetical protein DMG69_09735 [Acidobacteriota bacterium]